ncbi:hypothetical protein GCM10007919_44710 [Rhizobium indigoferae]|nr:hypothetical protein GCM10007919_44710 [Rhizobium indigoferae]
MKILDFNLHLLAQISVKCAKRFIEQQDRRIRDQGARKGYALLLTPAQLGRHATTEFTEADALKHPANPLRPFRAIDTTHFKWKFEVAGDGQVREKCVTLEYNSLIASIRRNFRD